MRKITTLFLSLLLFAACSKDDDNGENIKKSDAKAITAFAFTSADNEALAEDVKAEIDEAEKTITAEVPSGTDIKALKPSITVSARAKVSPESKAVKDFSEAVVYTITAEDGSEAKYTVAVTVAKSDAKRITSFVFRAEENDALSEDVEGIINEEIKTIVAEMPFGTDVAALRPNIAISGGATITPANKVATDFSEAVEYTVTAEDSSNNKYKVMVMVDPVDSDAKQLTAFEFIAADNKTLRENVTLEVNENNKTIMVEMPLGTDLATLSPKIVVSEGASVAPEGNVERDFSKTVSYTVTAKNGSTQTYNVTLSVKQPTSEREILVALYNANSESTLDWNLNDENMENWEGVFVENSKVVKLDFSSNGLNRLPPFIGDLTGLQELDVSSNSIRTVPIEIGNLSNLRVLELAATRLTSIPSEIGNLTNLKQLDLSINGLKSLPTEIGNLQNLEKLDLGNTNLTSVPTEIGDLSKLLELNLRRNSIDEFPTSFTRLTNLTILNLSGNSLTSIPSMIGSLTTLERLDIDNNELSNLPAELGNLSNLKELYAWGNQLTALPIEIGNLTNMVRLGLSQNKLESLPKEMGQLINLTTLDLSKNSLTTIPKEICDLNIEDIRLDDNVGCEE
ncbi:leucine-rich repeat domain-containing protein [uncultured Croceitalea sp.]|uniref:leucine-rich repeat domain-containing protein n=1 Tax=uncultured Croceitalea sp. TaxID=1798908 RepID=UPI0033068007